MDRTITKKGATKQTHKRSLIDTDRHKCRHESIHNTQTHTHTHPYIHTKTLTHPMFSHRTHESRTAKQK